MQIKQAEIQHRNATIVSVGTLAGLLFSGAWWLSGQAAKDKTWPLEQKISTVEIKVGKVEATQDALIKRFDRFEAKQDKMLDLLLNERK